MIQPEELFTKKILVRAPGTIEEIVLSFPLMHALKAEFGEGSQLYVIINEGLPNVYESLPFKIYAYRFPKEKDSLIGIHHFCYNLNDVFNIDVFFDLENSLKSSWMGWAFRCNERVGLKTGLNKFLLTHQLEAVPSKKYDNYSLKFLESFAGVDSKTLKVIGVDLPEPSDDPTLLDIVKAEEDNPFGIEDSAPYVLVLIKTISEEKKNVTLWQDFFDCHINQRFIICFNCLETDEFVEENEVERIKASWETKNTYDFLNVSSFEELSKLIQNSMYVFTDEYWRGNIVSYLGKSSFVFVDQFLPIPYLEHFQLIPTVIKLSANVPVRITTEGEPSKVEKMSQIVDYVQKLFDAEEDGKVMKGGQSLARANKAS